MKLIEARFCPDCNEVFCNKGTDEQSAICPSCTNRLTIFLSDFHRYGGVSKDILRQDSEEKKYEHICR